MHVLSLVVFARVRFPPIPSDGQTFCYHMASDKHDTSVELLLGPEDDYVFKPGETFCVSVALLPQNKFPTAITQIFLYIGLRGGDKRVYRLMHDTPGNDPDVMKFDFEYIVPRNIQCARNNNAILEFGWGQEMQYTWEDAMKYFQKRGQEHNILLTLPIAQPVGVKYDFKVDLCAPMPELVVGGDSLALDLATLLQNNYPGAISQLFVYIKDESGGIDVCCIQNTVPGENPPVLRGGVVYHVSEDLVGQTLEIGWASDLQYTFKDAVDNFNKNPNGHLLGHVKVVAQNHPDAEKARLQGVSGSSTPKSIPKKMQDFVVEYFSDTGERAKDLAKYGAKYAAQQGLKMGARRMLAAEVAKATLKQTALAGGRRAAVVAAGSARGMRAASGFALGLKAVKGTNPAALASIPGEMLGSYTGGKLGKALGSEEAGKNIGGLAGAVGVGAALGSVVPGAGTAAGAVAGAVSWATGKVIEGLFSLF